MAGEGTGGQEDFALSANLSRSRVAFARARFYPPLSPPPPPSFTSFHSFFHRHPSPPSTLILAKQKATGHASGSRVSDARFILHLPADVPYIFYRAAAQNQKVSLFFPLLSLPLSLFFFLPRYGRINDATRDSVYITLNATQRCAPRSTSDKISRIFSSIIRGLLFN